MSHTVLKKQENKYCENFKEIILEDLLISESKAGRVDICKDKAKLVEDVPNYAKSHEEFIDINKMKRLINFRNWGLY